MSDTNQIMITKPTVIQKLLSILESIHTTAELIIGNGKIMLQSINPSKTILYTVELNPNLFGPIDFSGNYLITLKNFLHTDITGAIQMERFETVALDELTEERLNSLENIEMIAAVMFESSELRKQLGIMEKKHDVIHLETCKGKRGFIFRACVYDAIERSTLLEFKEEITQKYTNPTNSEFSIQITDFMAKRIKAFTSLPTKRFWIRHSNLNANNGNLISLETICNEFTLKMYLGSRET